jgi:membrane-bound inhibitor of C-type lysozyme
MRHVKRRSGFVLPVLALLLGSCSATPPQTHYLCGDGTEFTTTGGGDDITVHIAGDDIRLPRVHSGSGEKYTDRRLLYWNKGDEAILASSDHGMVRCKEK